jgi:enoyl-CoA hydratase/carnithine racemase
MSDIVSKLSDGILRVELNRPAKKNAMTGAMYGRLAEIFGEAAHDDAVRVVFWSGAGSDFCAGNDVQDFLENPPGPDNFPQRQLMDALVGFEKPIVVAVQGWAVGVGATMLTHGDFVYAGETAKFQAPFINLGLTPEFGSSFSLPMQVGRLAATEMLLLGAPVTAARAAELGLATRAVPDEDLLATAAATAQQLADKPGDALRASKRLIKRSSMGALREAMDVENQEFFARLGSAEAQEALTAFLEKRPPNFAASTKPR